MQDGKKGKPWKHTALKYAGLAIAGIILFRIGAAVAYAQRGYKAIGGEVFALFLPFFYWIISDTVKDMLDIFTDEPELEVDYRKGSRNRWHTSKHGTDAHAVRLMIPQEKPGNVQSVTSDRNAGQLAGEEKESGSQKTQPLALSTAQSGHCEKPT